jgi:hypothetical protein
MLVVTGRPAGVLEDLSIFHLCVSTTRLTFIVSTWEGKAILGPATEQTIPIMGANPVPSGPSTDHSIGRDLFRRPWK